MDIFFRKKGKGPALIILHGLFGSSDNWLPIAKEMEKYFTVYLTDARNHGRSGHCHIHSYDAMADDIAELMEKEHVAEAHFMGHSMGGKTVFLFALRYPEKTKSCIIVDIAPVKTHKNDHYEEINNKLYSILSILKSIPLQQISKREEIHAHLSRAIKAPALQQLFLKNIVRQANGRYIWKFNLDALFANLPIIIGDIVIPENVRINEQTNMLFIKGVLSNYLQDEDIEYARRFFPATHQVSVPNAGHWVHVDNPHVFLLSIKNFLLPYGTSPEK